MKKQTIALIIVAILIFISAILIYEKDSKPLVCFDKNCFEVEIAKTPQERSQGLMFRESLDENTGMLFIYEEDEIYSFWMKDTLIPLDIIWIKSELEVVHIESNVLPCLVDSKEPCEVYSSDENARYILEINAGTASLSGIFEGKSVKLFNVE